MALTLAKAQNYLRVRERLRTFPRPLAALLLAAAILSVAWSTADAPLNGYDESAHASYVQNLAENGTKPSFTTGSGTESTELASADYFFGLHPAVGIFNARPNWSKADQRQFDKIMAGFTPAERKNAGGPNAIGKNPPLYYAYQAVWYRIGYDLPILSRLYLMRLANLPLVLITVLFTWLLAGELFKRLWLRATATAIVALQPMVVFMNSVINPDTQLGAVWAAFAYTGVILVKRGPSKRRLAAATLLLIASFLTHGRGIALIVPYVVAIFLSLWRHRARYPRAVWVFPVSVVILAVTGAEILTHSGAYGGELTLGANFRLTGFLSYVWQYYFPKLWFLTTPPGPNYGFKQMIVDEFIGGRFGSLEVGFSSGVYDLLNILAWTIIGGIVVGFVAYRRRVAQVWDIALLLGTIVVAQMTLLHVVSFRSLAGGTGDPLIVGRYLLPLAAIYGIGAAFVSAAAGRRFGPYIAVSLVSISLALQLGGLFSMVTRFYG